jgi:hypothetical protein
MGDATKGKSLKKKALADEIKNMNGILSPPSFTSNRLLTRHPKEYPSDDHIAEADFNAR